MEEIVFRPQKGFQEKFNQSRADIVIGGGAAGAGKSYALLLEPLFHVNNKNFSAVFFRRTYPEIMNPGGLWSESTKIYSFLGAKASDVKWTFPSGATVSFSHLQHEKDIYSFQGSQIPLICFDEVTHFSETMFFYLLSRNRSMCGVKPYIRATCNPDPNSFLVIGDRGWGSGLISWWIDEDGWPIQERVGLERYFIRDNNTYIWGSTKQEVIDQSKHIIEKTKTKRAEDLIKSITFIPGNIHDNKILNDKDPSYIANLLSQDEETRMRLLDGNWKIKFDGNNLIDYNSIAAIFSNTFNAGRVGDKYYITCDPAGMGKDFCVIWVWHGFETIFLNIISKSSPKEIREEIEKLRLKFRVPINQVMIDADGPIGESLLRSANYIAYRGGRPAVIDRNSNDRTPQNYFNFKTQCTYKFADYVNNGMVWVNITPETVIIDGVKTMKIKIGNQVINIRDEIRRGLNTIKIKEAMEGKKKISSKEEQKNILKRSPDFEDALIIRIGFDFIKPPSYLK